METHPGNEEEQEQETPQRKGAKEGAREGGEDSRAVSDDVKKALRVC